MLFKNKLQLKSISLFVAVTFICFSEGSPSAYAALNTPIPTEQISLSKSLEVVNEIELPKKWGTIEERYQGSGDKLIIIIRDAHAIPDAQKNIQKTIKHFQKDYGVKVVGLEGTSAPLDPTLFRNFPDQKLLRKVLKNYHDRGELPAGATAAIFNETESVYVGIENWDLYEANVWYYLEAFNQQLKIEEHLREYEKEIEEEKTFAYSKSLQTLDKLLTGFYSNYSDLPKVLTELSKIKTPQPGSKIALLLNELSANSDDTLLDVEVKKIASAVRRHLITLPKSKVIDKDRSLFNVKSQQYQTSRISVKDFALFLRKIVSKYKIPVKVSKRLALSVGEQKKLRDIQGTELFDQIELYIEEVKSKLFENERQKELDQKSQEVALLRRLNKMELDQKDWKKVQRMGDGGWGVVKRIFSNPNFLTPNPFLSHIKFYETAKTRDQVFYQKMMKHIEKRDGGILVAGGFHSEGVKRLLKEKDLSYLLVMPAVKLMPEQVNYEAHMRGEVSWKDYLEVKEGTVDNYIAFARSVRDHLLSTQIKRGLGTQIKNGSGLVFDPSDRSAFDPRVAKQWRDEIIRNLAKENRLAEAKEYTRFIDELSVGSRALSESENPLVQAAQKFAEGIKDLYLKDQISEQNISNLLRPTSVAGAPLTSPGSMLNSRTRVAGNLTPILSSESRSQRIAARTQLASETRALAFWEEREEREEAVSNKIAAGLPLSRLEGVSEIVAREDLKLAQAFARGMVDSNEFVFDDNLPRESQEEQLGFLADTTRPYVLMTWEEFLDYHQENPNNIETVKENFGELEPEDVILSIVLNPEEIQPILIRGLYGLKVEKLPGRNNHRELSAYKFTISSQDDWDFSQPIDTQEISFQLTSNGLEMIDASETRVVRGGRDDGVDPALLETRQLRVGASGRLEGVDGVLAGLVADNEKGPKISDEEQKQEITLGETQGLVAHFSDLGVIRVHPNLSLKVRQTREGSYQLDFSTDGETYKESSLTLEKGVSISFFRKDKNIAIRVENQSAQTRQRIDLEIEDKGVYLSEDQNNFIIRVPEKGFFSFEVPGVSQNTPSVFVSRRISDVDTLFQNLISAKDEKAEVEAKRNINTFIRETIGASSKLTDEDPEKQELLDFAKIITYRLQLHNSLISQNASETRNSRSAAMDLFQQSSSLYETKQGGAVKAKKQDGSVDPDNVEVLNYFEVLSGISLDIIVPDSTGSILVFEYGKSKADIFAELARKIVEVNTRAGSQQIPVFHSEDGNEAGFPNLDEIEQGIEDGSILSKDGRKLFRASAPENKGDVLEVTSAQTDTEALARKVVEDNEKLGASQIFVFYEENGSGARALSLDDVRKGIENGSIISKDGRKLFDAPKDPFDDIFVTSPTQKTSKVTVPEKHSEQVDTKTLERQVLERYPTRGTTEIPIFPSETIGGAADFQPRSVVEEKIEAGEIISTDGKRLFYASKTTSVSATSSTTTPAEQSTGSPVTQAQAFSALDAFFEKYTDSFLSWAADIKGKKFESEGEEFEIDYQTFQAWRAARGAELIEGQEGEIRNAQTAPELKNALDRAKQRVKKAAILLNSEDADLDSLERAIQEGERRLEDLRAQADEEDSKSSAIFWHQLFRSLVGEGSQVYQDEFERAFRGKTWSVPRGRAIEIWNSLASEEFQVNLDQISEQGIIAALKRVAQGSVSESDIKNFLEQIIDFASQSGHSVLATEARENLENIETLLAIRAEYSRIGTLISLSYRSSDISLLTDVEEAIQNFRGTLNDLPGTVLASYFREELEKLEANIAGQRQLSQTNINNWKNRLSKLPTTEEKLEFFFNRLFFNVLDGRRQSENYQGVGQKELAQIARALDSRFGDLLADLFELEETARKLKREDSENRELSRIRRSFYSQQLSLNEYLMHYGFLVYAQFENLNDKKSFMIPTIHYRVGKIKNRGRERVYRLDGEIVVPIHLETIGHSKDMDAPKDTKGMSLMDGDVVVWLDGDRKKAGDLARRVRNLTRTDERVDSLDQLLKKQWGTVRNSESGKRVKAHKLSLNQLIDIIEADLALYVEIHEVRHKFDEIRGNQGIRSSFDAEVSAFLAMTGVKINGYLPYYSLHQELERISSVSRADYEVRRNSVKGPHYRAVLENINGIAATLKGPDGQAFENIPEDLSLPHSQFKRYRDELAQAIEKLTPEEIRQRARDRYKKRFGRDLLVGSFQESNPPESFDSVSEFQNAMLSEFQGEDNRIERKLLVALRKAVEVKREGGTGEDIVKTALSTLNEWDIVVTPSDITRYVRLRRPEFLEDLRTVRHSVLQTFDSSDVAPDYWKAARNLRQKTTLIEYVSSNIERRLSSESRTTESIFAHMIRESQRKIAFMSASRKLKQVRVAYYGDPKDEEREQAYRTAQAAFVKQWLESEAELIDDAVTRYQEASGFSSDAFKTKISAIYSDGKYQHKVAVEDVFSSLEKIMNKSEAVKEEPLLSLAMTLLTNRLKKLIEEVADGILLDSSNLVGETFDSERHDALQARSGTGRPSSEILEVVVSGFQASQQNPDSTFIYPKVIVSSQSESRMVAFDFDEEALIGQMEATGYELRAIPIALDQLREILGSGVLEEYKGYLPVQFLGTSEGMDTFLLRDESGDERIVRIPTSLENSRDLLSDRSDRSEEGSSGVNPSETVVFDSDREFLLSPEEQFSLRLIEVVNQIISERLKEGEEFDAIQADLTEAVEHIFLGPEGTGPGYGITQFLFAIDDAKYDFGLEWTEQSRKVLVALADQTDEDNFLKAKRTPQLIRNILRGQLESDRKLDLLIDFVEKLELEINALEQAEPKSLDEKKNLKEDVVKQLKKVNRKLNSNFSSKQKVILSKLKVKLNAILENVESEGFKLYEKLTLESSLKEVVERFTKEEEILENADFLKAYLAIEKKLKPLKAKTNIYRNSLVYDFEQVAENERTLRALLFEMQKNRKEFEEAPTVSFEGDVEMYQKGRERAILVITRAQAALNQPKSKAYQNFLIYQKVVEVIEKNLDVLEEAYKRGETFIKLERPFSDLGVEKLLPIEAIDLPKLELQETEKTKNIVLEFTRYRNWLIEFSAKSRSLVHKNLSQQSYELRDRINVIYGMLDQANYSRLFSETDQLLSDPAMRSALNRAVNRYQNATVITNSKDVTQQRLNMLRRMVLLYGSEKGFFHKSHERAFEGEVEVDDGFKNRYQAIENNLKIFFNTEPILADEFDPDGELERSNKRFDPVFVQAFLDIMTEKRTGKNLNENRSRQLSQFVAKGSLGTRSMDLVPSVKKSESRSIEDQALDLADNLRDISFRDIPEVFDVFVEETLNQPDVKERDLQVGRVIKVILEQYNDVLEGDLPNRTELLQEGRQLIEGILTLYASGLDSEEKRVQFTALIRAAETYASEEKVREAWGAARGVSQKKSTEAVASPSVLSTDQVIDILTSPETGYFVSSHWKPNFYDKTKSREVEEVGEAIDLRSFGENGFQIGIAQGVTIENEKSGQKIVANGLYRLPGEQSSGETEYWSRTQGFLRDEAKEIPLLFAYELGTIDRDVKEVPVRGGIGRLLKRTETVETETWRPVSVKEALLKSRPESQNENVIVLSFATAPADSKGRKAGSTFQTLLLPQSVFEKIKDQLIQNPELIYEVIKQRSSKFAAEMEERYQKEGPIGEGYGEARPTPQVLRDLKPERINDPNTLNPFLSQSNQERLYSREVRARSESRQDLGTRSMDLVPSGLDLAVLRVVLSQPEVAEALGVDGRSESRAMALESLESFASMEKLNFGGKEIEIKFLTAGGDTVDLHLESLGYRSTQDNIVLIALSQDGDYVVVKYGQGDDAQAVAKGAVLQEILAKISQGAEDPEQLQAAQEALKYFPELVFHGVVDPKVFQDILPEELRPQMDGGVLYVAVKKNPRGLTLAEMKDSSMSLKLQVFEKFLEASEVLFKAGIAMLDIKPSNIYATFKEVDGQEQVDQIFFIDPDAGKFVDILETPNIENGKNPIEFSEEHPLSPQSLAKKLGEGATIEDKRLVTKIFSALANPNSPFFYKDAASFREQMEKTNRENALSYLMTHQTVATIFTSLFKDPVHLAGIRKEITGETQKEYTEHRTGLAVDGEFISKHLNETKYEEEAEELRVLVNRLRALKVFDEARGTEVAPAQERFQELREALQEMKAVIESISKKAREDYEAVKTQLLSRIQADYPAAPAVIAVRRFLMALEKKPEGPELIEKIEKANSLLTALGESEGEVVKSLIASLESLKKDETKSESRTVVAGRTADVLGSVIRDRDKLLVQLKAREIEVGVLDPDGAIERLEEIMQSLPEKLVGYEAVQLLGTGLDGEVYLLEDNEGNKKVLKIAGGMQAAIGMVEQAQESIGAEAIDLEKVSQRITAINNERIAVPQVDHIFFVGDDDPDEEEVPLAKAFVRDYVEDLSLEKAVQAGVITIEGFAIAFTELMQTVEGLGLNPFDLMARNNLRITSDGKLSALDFGNMRAEIKEASLSIEERTQEIVEAVKIEVILNRLGKQYSNSILLEQGIVSAESTAVKRAVEEALEREFPETQGNPGLKGRISGELKKVLDNRIEVARAAVASESRSFRQRTVNGEPIPMRVLKPNQPIQLSLNRENGRVFANVFYLSSKNAFVIEYPGNDSARILKVGEQGLVEFPVNQEGDRLRKGTNGDLTYSDMVRFRFFVLPNGKEIILNARNKNVLVDGKQVGTLGHHFPIEGVDRSFSVEESLRDLVGELENAYDEGAINFSEIKNANERFKEEGTTESFESLLESAGIDQRSFVDRILRTPLLSGDAVFKELERVVREKESFLDNSKVIEAKDFLKELLKLDFLRDKSITELQKELPRYFEQLKKYQEPKGNSFSKFFRMVWGFIAKALNFLNWSRMQDSLVRNEQVGQIFKILEPFPEEKTIAITGNILKLIQDERNFSEAKRFEYRQEQALLHTQNALRAIARLITSGSLKRVTEDKTEEDRAERTAFSQLMGKSFSSGVSEKLPLLEKIEKALGQRIALLEPLASEDNPEARKLLETVKLVKVEVEKRQIVLQLEKFGDLVDAGDGEGDFRGSIPLSFEFPPSSETRANLDVKLLNTPIREIESLKAINFDSKFYMQVPSMFDPDVTLGTILDLGTGKIHQRAINILDSSLASPESRVTYSENYQQEYLRFILEAQQIIQLKPGQGKIEKTRAFQEALESDNTVIDREEAIALLTIVSLDNLEIAKLFLTEMELGVKVRKRLPAAVFFVLPLVGILSIASIIVHFYVVIEKGKPLNVFRVLGSAASLIASITFFLLDIMKDTDNPGYFLSRYIDATAFRDLSSASQARLLKIAQAYLKGEISFQANLPEVFSQVLAVFPESNKQKYIQYAYEKLLLTVSKEERKQIKNMTASEMNQFMNFLSSETRVNFLNEIAYQRTIGFLKQFAFNQTVDDEALGGLKGVLLSQKEQLELSSPGDPRAKLLLLLIEFVESARDQNYEAAKNKKDEYLRLAEPFYRDLARDIAFLMELILQASDPNSYLNQDPNNYFFEIFVHEIAKAKDGELGSLPSLKLNALYLAARAIRSKEDVSFMLTDSLYEFPQWIARFKIIEAVREAERVSQIGRTWKSIIEVHLEAARDIADLLNTTVPFQKAQSQQGFFRGFLDIYNSFLEDHADVQSAESISQSRAVRILSEIGPIYKNTLTTFMDLPRSESRNQLISEIEPIIESDGNLLFSSDRVRDFVESPLVRPVQELFSRNILTSSSSANKNNLIFEALNDGNYYANVYFNAKFLSESNARALKDLDEKAFSGWSYGKLRVRQTEPDNQRGHTYQLFIPITNEIRENELSDFLSSLFQETFELQELTWARFTLEDIRERFGNPAMTDEEAKLEGFYFDSETKYFYYSQEQLENAKRWETLQLRQVPEVKNSETLSDFASSETRISVSERSEEPFAAVAASEAEEVSVSEVVSADLQNRVSELFVKQYRGDLEARGELETIMNEVTNDFENLKALDLFLGGVLAAVKAQAKLETDQMAQDRANKAADILRILKENLPVLVKKLGDKKATLALSPKNRDYELFADFSNWIEMVHILGGKVEKKHVDALRNAGISFTPTKRIDRIRLFDQEVMPAVDSLDLVSEMSNLLRFGANEENYKFAKNDSIAFYDQAVALALQVVVSIVAANKLNQSQANLLNQAAEQGVDALSLAKQVEVRKIKGKLVKEVGEWLGQDLTKTLQLSGGGIQFLMDQINEIVSDHELGRAVSAAA